jgi:hypothetical protein
MWLFRQEDPELRALKKQLKEAEEGAKQAKIESEARIKQIREESMQWHAEHQARSRAQQEEFFRRMEELARESGQSVEQLYKQVRARMQADLDRLTGQIEAPSGEKPASKDDEQSAKPD